MEVTVLQAVFAEYGIQGLLAALIIILYIKQGRCDLKSCKHLKNLKNSIMKEITEWNKFLRKADRVIKEEFNRFIDLKKSELFTLVENESFAIIYGDMLKDIVFNIREELEQAVRENGWLNKEDEDFQAFSKNLINTKYQDIVRYENRNWREDLIGISYSAWKTDQRSRKYEFDSICFSMLTRIKGHYRGYKRKVS